VMVELFSRVMAIPPVSSFDGQKEKEPEVEKLAVFHSMNTER